MFTWLDTRRTFIVEKVFLYIHTLRLFIYNIWCTVNDGPSDSLCLRRKDDVQHERNQITIWTPWWHYTSWLTVHRNSIINSRNRFCVMPVHLMRIYIHTSICSIQTGRFECQLQYVISLLMLCKLLSLFPQSGFPWNRLALTHRLQSPCFCHLTELVNGRSIFFFEFQTQVFLSSKSTY